MLPVLLAVLAAAPLTTAAERSGWKTTGRYDEVMQLCAAFQKTYAPRVRCETFGTTPQGRPMLALIASADGTTTPALIRRRDRPVVLLQGGIHAGEIDGKDAGFWLLRDLFEGKAEPKALEKVTVVFVPVFNVDGHERFGPNHRPNQNGPAEMGWRVTAHNLNLNRDYAKADAPEMVAMLAFLRRYDPILYADLHVTDGAKFQHDVSVAIEPWAAHSEALRPFGRALKTSVLQGLQAEGHKPIGFYPSFVREDDPSSGFVYGVPPPRLSHGYWPLRNRFAVLVETHSWKDYATRVRATYHTARLLLRGAASDGARWLKAAREADAKDKASAPGELILSWTQTKESQTIDFLGYAYERAPSDVSGQPWVRYDDAKPQVWRVPYFETLTPKLTAFAPAGYVVPRAWAPLVAERLQRHGLHFRALRAPIADAVVEAFRASEAQFRPEPYEGRQPVKVLGAWSEQARTLEAGALFVPTAQPSRALVVHLLEPTAPDSLMGWGFFNAVFEQKEYLEDYLTEAYARELLKDPEVKKDFEKTLQRDGGVPAKERLQYFYRRHPSFDARLNEYPVVRVGFVPDR